MKFSMSLCTKNGCSKQRQFLQHMFHIPANISKYILKIDSVKYMFLHKFYLAKKDYTKVTPGYFG